MPTPDRPSTCRSPNPAPPADEASRPQPAAWSTPNPPPRSPIQSVWVASFSGVVMASSSSVADRHDWLLASSARRYLRRCSRAPLSRGIKAAGRLTASSLEDDSGDMRRHDQQPRQSRCAAPVCPRRNTTPPQEQASSINCQGNPTTRARHRAAGASELGVLPTGSVKLR